MEFRFEQPWLLLGVVLPLLVLVWSRPRGGAAWSGTIIAASGTSAAHPIRSSTGPWFFRSLVALGLIGLVIAAARPQYGRSIVERTQSGRDLMLVIDLSFSMSVDDIKNDDRRQDRLRTVFAAARDFVARRPDDRIGLNFFSSRAVTACPPTFDHQTVLQFLEQMERQQRAIWDRGDERGVLGGETNLGLGVAMAARALRDRGAPGRAIILITDGADSRTMRGWIDPLVAARSAAAAGVKVYGIGVGDPDGTLTKRDVFGRLRQFNVPAELLPDRDRLNAIAAAGNGAAYTATDAAGLTTVLKAIEKLEPSRADIRTSDDYTDRWRWPLLIGICFIAVAVVIEPRIRGVA